MRRVCIISTYSSEKVIGRELYTLLYDKFHNFDIFIFVFTIAHDDPVRVISVWCCYTLYEKSTGSTRATSRASSRPCSSFLYVPMRTHNLRVYGSTSIKMQFRGNCNLKKNITFDYDSDTHASNFSYKKSNDNFAYAKWEVDDNDMLDVVYLFLQGGGLQV